MADTIPILKNYPVKINNTAIPFSGSMTENYGTIESVNTSEAGTDIAQVQRTDKLTLSIQYVMVSTFLATLEAWNKDPSNKEVQIYDFVTGAYKTRIMRMRNYKKSLYKHSEELTVTTGVWKVSFDLIEK